MDDKSLRRSLRLSTVPRWAVVPTIQKQTVSEHVHRGAVILAWLLGRVRDSEIADLSDIAPIAHSAWLFHDDDESITGDIASNAKTRDYSSTTMLDDFLKIVDSLEALLFLHEERALGNSHASPSSDVYSDVLHKAYRAQDRFLQKIDPKGDFRCDFVASFIHRICGTVHIHPGMEAE